jgi:hypothetical protein
VGESFPGLGAEVAGGVPVCHEALSLVLVASQGRAMLEQGLDEAVPLAVIHAAEAGLGERLHGGQHQLLVEVRLRVLLADHCKGEE